MQYPSDHTGLEVMFIVPIAARFSKAEDSETIVEKIRLYTHVANMFRFDID